MNANLLHAWQTPAGPFRYVVGGGGGQPQFNYDGDRADKQIQAGASGELKNYWNFTAIWFRNFPHLDDRLTRGGPVLGHAGFDAQIWNLSTDARLPLVLGLNLFIATGLEGLNNSSNLSFSASWKPASNVVLSL